MYTFFIQLDTSLPIIFRFTFFITANSQRRYSVKVWAGVINNRIIGPHRLGNLNAVTYQEFLVHTLPLLLARELDKEEIPHIIFQQDGASPHTANCTQELLHELFPNGYIGRGGMVDWPAR